MLFPVRMLRLYGARPLRRRPHGLAPPAHEKGIEAVVAAVGHNTKAARKERNADLLHAVNFGKRDLHSVDLARRELRIEMKARIREDGVPLHGVSIAARAQ